MARQVRVRGARHRRGIARWSVATLVIALALPLLLSLQVSSAPAHKEAQELEVATVQYEQGGEPGTCWRSTAHTLEKNALGMTVLDVQHEVRWCSDGEVVTSTAPNAWISQALFGSWELAEVTDSHYSVTPEGATRMHFIRRLDFRSGSIASSRTHCLEIDLYTDGRAEGRQC